MSKKSPRWSARKFLAGDESPYRVAIAPKASVPVEAQGKLLPISVMVDYLHAVRGKGPQKGESLLEVVAALLCAAHGLNRGKVAARRFVEKHRQLIRAAVKNDPSPRPAHPSNAAAAAAREAAREPRIVPDDVAASASFLDTYEWRRIRMQALKKHGARCMCCGASPATGAVMNVDHIRPRRLFPELALDINNLQVLCHECNHGKGNWDMTDWRVAERVCDG